MKRAQRGVALITIMLIVAVATILAVQMASDQNLAVSQAASIFDNVQAREYAYGGEALARQILFEDFKKQPTKDDLSEDWASNKLSYDYDQGHIDLAIEDLQGRLNLNSVAQQGAAGALAQGRLRALLANLGIDPMFVNRLVDWVDTNQQKMPMGADDEDYLSLDHPYRTAGHPMEDMTEMRLLLGMDNATYLAMAPFVCALPDLATSVNVNTASPEVLQAIIPNLSADQAKNIASTRDTEHGFNNVQAFLSAANLPANVQLTGLGVQSSYFEVRVRARYRDRFAYLTSIIQRNPADGSMRVIYRNLSRKIYPVAATKNQSSGQSSSQSPGQATGNGNG